jgi:hypothetical protein
MQGFLLMIRQWIATISDTRSPQGMLGSLMAVVPPFGFPREKMHKIYIFYCRAFF